MSTPTLENSWTFSVNNRIVIPYTNSPAVTNKARQLMFAIKYGLKNAGIDVIGSSDTYTAGIDNVDRWTTWSNVLERYSGGWCYSWMIMGNATMGHFLFTFVSGYTQWDVYYSPQGIFTWNGQLYTRPSATDELRLTIANQYFSTNNVADVVWHLMVDSTKTRFRFIAQETGVNVLCFVIDKFNNDDMIWPRAYCGFSPSWYNVDILGSYNYLFSSTSWSTKTRSPTNVALSGQLSTNVENTTLLGTPQQFYLIGENSCTNEVTGECDFLKIGYTVPGVGRCGYIQDLWASSTYVPNGTTFPINDTKRRFVQFGVLIFPWNGSVPQIA